MITRNKQNKQANNLVFDLVVTDFKITNNNILKYIRYSKYVSR